ncbi:hypothetical protein KP509_27G024700 [Ceratopteris richardii]|uniref:Beta-glucosidase n=1 Tax=Ceratopteris richardii TaxID=49495 RepID=A0A8T2RH41_CERRI|nr:hypothetical protein KP509_27G024700 [Ceratopteris richardii]KAH7294921.1 hypothetical protein KP509_27G024700 [Ceratopteris richardii]
MAPFRPCRFMHSCCSPAEKPQKFNKIHRDSFPENFAFGVSTSAYQVEGAVSTDGRSMSIWDSFSHVRGNIYDNSTGDVTCDHYHRYKEDIQLMVALGIDAYRLSISWSRILPDNTGRVNQAGAAFYNSIINELLHHGIEPYVTLYHWDMPQYLENDPQVKGWRTRKIITHYVYFATTCFRLFGDRVKNWITVNEILNIAVSGYGTGTRAPGRCSVISGTQKRVYIGDSATEPYLVAHNVLLSHAAAVKLYREQFQSEQKGRIGIALNSKWYEPYTEDKHNVSAAQRCLEFELAWFLDPIFFGDYPVSMRITAGSRLPSFTEDDTKELVKSVDFLGINYYTANYAQNSDEELDPSLRWYSTDRQASVSSRGADGELIGEAMGPSDGGWIYDCPWGLRRLLAWMQARYGKEEFQDCPILITENGCSDPELNLSVKKAKQDEWRIRYLHGILQHLLDTIRNDGCNIQGYFIWSLLDNFEWDKGQAFRFGIYYVHHQWNLNRDPKLSARWLTALVWKWEVKLFDK